MMAFQKSSKEEAKRWHAIEKIENYASETITWRIICVFLLISAFIWANCPIKVINVLKGLRGGLRNAENFSRLQIHDNSRPIIVGQKEVERKEKAVALRGQKNTENEKR